MTLGLHTLYWMDSAVQVEQEELLVEMLCFKTTDFQERKTNFHQPPQ